MRYRARLSEKRHLILVILPLDVAFAQHVSRHLGPSNRVSQVLRDEDGPDASLARVWGTAELRHERDGYFICERIHALPGEYTDGVERGEHVPTERGV